MIGSNTDIYVLLHEWEYVSFITGLYHILTNATPCPPYPQLSLIRLHGESFAIGDVGQLLFGDVQLLPKVRALHLGRAYPHLQFSVLCSQSSHELTQVLSGQRSKAVTAATVTAVVVASHHLARDCVDVGKVLDKRLARLTAQRPTTTPRRLMSVPSTFGDGAAGGTAGNVL